MNNRLEIQADRHEEKIFARVLDTIFFAATAYTPDDTEVTDTESIIIDPDYHDPSFRRKRSHAMDLTSNQYGAASLENRSDLDLSPIELAITNHNIRLVMHFLTQAYPAFYKIIFLKLAVQHGCLEIVKFMIKDKWNINDFTIWNQHTPLITASIYNQTQIAATLIAFGASLEHQDNFGQTPLMHAVMNCNIKITKLLIDLGANIFATDTKGNNILDLLNKEIANAELHQDSLTPELNRKKIIYARLLDYLISHTKLAHQTNNRDIFNYSMSDHLMLKFKSGEAYFPKIMSSIIFSYLDTNKIWCLWSLSSHIKVSPKPVYTLSIFNTIKAHADVRLFAMPAKQHEEQDSVIIYG